MRIDDPTRTPQAHSTERPDAAGAARKGSAVSPSPDGDQAAVSDFAAALSPDSARIEALRMQIEKGEYHVSADVLASSIIDDHLKR